MIADAHLQQARCIAYIQQRPGQPKRKIAAELTEAHGVSLNRALSLVDRWWR